jgi:hypothetical protein
MSTLASDGAICSAIARVRFMASEPWMTAFGSSAIASSTAAISSSSGGSGMYSLAPARMAAAAVRASQSMPQAMMGTVMRSPSSSVISLAISLPTSTRIASALSPSQSAWWADSISDTCETRAPRERAIWLAAAIWPLKCPTIKMRIAPSFFYAFSFLIVIPAFAGMT